MVENLSVADVRLLIDNPSVETRMEAAGKIASSFELGQLSESERQIAEDIFRVMVKDAEERVRAALSTHLKHAQELSVDVARSLARDMSDAVAVPMLQVSEALSEEDLIEIVRTQGSSRQTAIAGRAVVSEVLAGALVDNGSEDAVATLVGNEGAKIDEATMNRVVDKFGDSEQVQTPLVMRATLPVTVSERLVARISDKLKDHLVTHHDLSADLASDLVLQSRERATLSLLSPGADDQDVERLVAELSRNGRLTTSIALRALCVGDLSFFEAAIAQMSGVSLINSRKLIHDPGALGLRTIYEKCDLPESLFIAFRIALDVLKETENERTDGDPGAVTKRMLERVLTQFEDLVDEHSADDVDFLLKKLGRVANAA